MTILRTLLRAALGALLLIGLAGSGTASACTPGPTSAADWQAIYDALPYYGDGNWSAPLPDGRTVWTTGDAIPRAGGEWASNTVTVVNTDGSTWQTANAVPNVPDEGGGQPVKTWLGPVAVVGTKLYATASMVRHLPDVGWFEALGTGIVEMDLPVGAWSPTLVEVSKYPWVETAVNWTAGLYPTTNGYGYVFGTKKRAGGEHDVYLAKTTIANLHNRAAWSYLCAGRWGSTATPWMPGGTDSAFSVRKDAAGWHLYTRHAGAHGEWIGDTGRWRWVPRGTQAGYLPGSHPEIKLASGKMLVSLNVTNSVQTPIGWLPQAKFIEVPR